MSRTRPASSPRARRIAREHGVELAGLPDPGRPIRSADVLTALEESAATSQAPTDTDAGGRMSGGMHRESVGWGWSMVQVDFSAVARSQGEVAQAWKSRHGVDLGNLPYVLRAVVLGLIAFPSLNRGPQGAQGSSASTIDVAVRSDPQASGLGDPVVRNAQGLGVGEIAQAVRRLAGAARSGNLSDQAYSGSGFGVRDHSFHGGVTSIPTLGPMGTCVLAVHQVAPTPHAIRTEDGTFGISIRPTAVLTMSWDQHSVDAASAAAFLGRVRDLLETTHWEVSLPG